MNSIQVPLPLRTSSYAIEPLLLNRWSPRSMSGESLSEVEMMTLFEAARWAPSTYNEQEWKFLYSPRTSPSWDAFFDLLTEANQVWCEKAALLVVIVSQKNLTKTGKPNPVHLFDCGNAFENLALQGAAMGLVIHGMSGFDYDCARTALHVPESHEVVAMFAAGKPGNVNDLPEKLRALEVPSSRKALHEIISEGRF